MRLVIEIFAARLALIMPALLFAVVAVFTTTTKAQEPVAEIPYRYAYNGWITVSVSVNDQGPYDFIVDTAATLSVVFENLNTQQNFPFVDGEPRRILGLIEANDLPPRFIGSIEVSGLAMEEVVSVVIPDWSTPRETPQGVLGLDFLGKYAVYIDPATQTIKLYDGGAPALVDGRGWTETRLDPIIFADGTSPLYVVNARIRRQRYPFILDLGASGTVINYPALRAMLKTRRVTVRTSARPTRLPQVQDLFGNEARSRLVRIQSMRIGRTVWRNQIVNVFNSKVFDELGVGEEPYGLLGADVVRDRRIVIDFSANRLHIGRKVERQAAPSN